MKTAFVAVNYNNNLITTNYVQSILFMKDCSRHLNKIIIVDNNSEEKDYKKLLCNLQDCDNVEIVRSNENLGYFGGLNLGLAQLKSDEHDYIIIGNNDLIFERDFLKKLHIKDYDKSCYAISPDLITLNKVHQNPQYRRRISELRKLCYTIYYSNYVLSLIMDSLLKGKRKFFPRKENNDYKIPGIIHLGKGACYILTHTFILNCQKLDNKVFMWCEEAVLTNQIISNKGVTFYDPDLKVHHMEKVTVGRISNKKRYELFRESFMKTKNYL